MKENISIQFSKSSKTAGCQSVRTDLVRTKCFSSRLIRGVGNFSYTVALSAIKINLKIKERKSENATCRAAWCLMYQFELDCRYYMFNIKFKVLGVPVFLIITHLIPDLSFQCMVRRVLVFFLFAFLITIRIC